MNDASSVNARGESVGDNKNIRHSAKNVLTTSITIKMKIFFSLFCRFHVRLSASGHGLLIALS